MIIERDRQWSAKVDIVDAPQIHLVLPARKEVVENSALENLRTAIRIAIYRHIQSLGSHRLSHTSWCDAEALGVHLPPASPILEPWTPAQADSDSDLDHELRSEEHTSELQSLMRISYAVFCLKKKINKLLLHNRLENHQQ